MPEVASIPLSPAILAYLSLMDKDYRWHIWLYISQDLPDPLPMLQSFF